MAQAPSRCLNHPERTAVTRCKQCHKPLCEKCIKKMPGGVFCSDECYQNMAAFQNRVRALDLQKKRGFSFGKWLTRAAVLIVVGAALYYVVVVQGVRSAGDFIDMLKGFGR